MNTSSAATAQKDVVPLGFDKIAVTRSDRKNADLRKLTAPLSPKEIRDMFGNLYFKGREYKEDLKAWCRAQTGTKTCTAFTFHVVIPDDKEHVVRIEIDFEKHAFNAERVPKPEKLGYVICCAQRKAGH